MKKALDAVGLVLIGIMILSFVGALRPAIDAGTSAAFWACAAGALGIIIYKKIILKRESGRDTGLK